LIPAGTTTDERGAPRTKGNTVDIGAVESGPLTIVVTTLTDSNDGTIDLPSGTSLRDAIAFANGNTSAYAHDTIVFAPGLTGTLALTLGALPAITASSLTITGPGANLLTIDGQNSSNILTIAAGADVTLSGLTLAHGKAPAGVASGGAIDNS